MPVNRFVTIPISDVAANIIVGLGALTTRSRLLQQSIYRNRKNKTETEHGY